MKQMFFLEKTSAIVMVCVSIDSQWRIVAEVYNGLWVGTDMLNTEQKYICTIFSCNATIKTPTITSCASLALLLQNGW